MSLRLLSRDELEAALRAVGAERYHNKHRFHARQYSGKCTYEEVQAWALNRYYYQAMIPIKDAIVLTRLTDAEDRRQWRKRIEDHDGMQPGDGGIERWLKLTDSLGFPRDYVESTAGILPATRFAVEAYATFVRERSPVEAVASSLTELFSPNIIGERMSGMLANYDYVSKDTLAYFSYRPTQAKRDADWALDFVKDTCQDAGAAAGGDQGARVQVRCALDTARRFVDRLCRELSFAGRLGAGYGGDAAQQGGVNDAAAISADAKPHLPRGMHLKHDATRDEWLLMAPERILKLNGVAVEILKRCDGNATLGEIVDQLAAAFAADRTRIDNDVRALLTELAAKRMVDL